MCSRTGILPRLATSLLAGSGSKKKWRNSSARKIAGIATESQRDRAESGLFLQSRSRKAERDPYNRKKAFVLTRPDSLRYGSLAPLEISEKSDVRCLTACFVRFR